MLTPPSACRPPFPVAQDLLQGAECGGVEVAKHHARPVVRHPHHSGFNTMLGDLRFVTELDRQLHMRLVEEFDLRRQFEKHPAQSHVLSDASLRATPRMTYFHRNFHSRARSPSTLHGTSPFLLHCARHTISTRGSTEPCSVTGHLDFI